MNREITINLLLDGFRYDYLKHAPFLQSLSKEAFVARTQEPFGFESIRPAVFAGVYPETSNISHIFWYSPETSKLGVFKLLQEMKFFQRRYFGNKYVDFAFDGLVKQLVKLRINSPLAKGYSNDANILQDFKDYVDIWKGNASLYEIPTILLVNFDSCEKKLCFMEGYLTGIPSTFEILNKNNRKWLYFGWSVFCLNIYNRKQINYIKYEISKCKPEFVHIHIGNTDGIGHKFGPNSNEIKKDIEKIDKIIEEFYHFLSLQFDTINLIIYGDHGMVPIANTIDIWNLLENSNLKIGKDYVVFLDSPMARFWFKNKNAEKKIRDILAQIDCGKILTDQDYGKHRIRFKHQRYGELIWLANPGTLIFPNFFQRSQPAKGMHGYDPKCLENQGLFMLLTNKDVEIKNREIVHLVDIFPTTLDLMNLPIPETCEGISLIKGDKNG